MDSSQDFRYRNPPIVEVVCEFRFVPAEPWDLTIPGLVYERLKETFPVRRPRKRLQTEAKAEAQGIRQEIQFTELAQFLGQDEVAFIQVGPNLLSINHLKPYPTWEIYKPMIQQGLKAYTGITAPKGIQRIGLRYINRIEIPDKHIELKDYFSFRPFVGSQLPQDLSGFVIAIQSNYEEGRDSMRIQLVTTDSETPDAAAFLLDLDYFLSQPESISLTEASEWIEQAHDRIQMAFEACLTDKLRDIFEVLQG
jgi:uncharacterized protein (TIGR04255 family)